MNIRVATYNLWHCRGCGFDYRRIGNIIRESRADLVGLQELDSGTGRSRGDDQLALLSESSGLSYSSFFPTMRYDGGYYGIGMLSRYPLTDIETVDLSVPGLEPRCVGLARVRVADGRDILFLNTHLSFEKPEVRRSQLLTVARIINTERRFIVTGDFNTDCREDFVAATAVCNRFALTSIGLTPGETVSYPTFRETRLSIDNILYDTETLRLVSSGMTDDTASDHNLLFAEFTDK